MLAGAAAAGATGTASVSLAQGSSVVNNKAMLIGALAVGGDASLSVQLSGSNVTGNELTAIGVIAVGGQGNVSVTGQNGTDVVVKRNSVDWQAAVITEQPLVKTVVEGIMGLGGCPPTWLPACLPARLPVCLLARLLLPLCMPRARSMPQLAQPTTSKHLLSHPLHCASASRQHQHEQNTDPAAPPSAPMPLYVLQALRTLPSTCPRR